MMKYLKIGGLCLAVLVAGFLIGSGSIGDIIRAWIAGTGSTADQAEVEENRQDLANRDVEAIGEALGSENPRVSYDLAIRCIVLTRRVPFDRLPEGGLSSDDLITIRANATTVAINQSEGGMQKVNEDLASVATPAYIDPLQRGNRQAAPPPPRRSDAEIAQYLTELENACSPLLGRSARQQNDE